MTGLGTGSWAEPARTLGKHVVRVLSEANAESVRYRYPGDEFVVPADPAFVRREYPGGLCVAAAACLRYQSCEHPGYGESEACHLVDELLSSGEDEKECCDFWGWPGDLEVVSAPDDEVTEVAIDRKRDKDGVWKKNTVTFSRSGHYLGVYREIPPRV